MKEKSSKNNRISLSEVARAAGVSKMTASRVLRGEGGYSEKTRDKVMEKVDQLGYLPNRLATVFAGDQSSTFVGVSIPDLGNEVFAQVLEGIDRKLGSFGRQTVLGLTQHTQQEEENWIRTVLSWQPAGLILTGRYHSPRATEMLRNAGIPIVEIWDLNSSPLDMSVGINHFDSGFDMGRYLTSCDYSNIGYVGTSHDTANAATTRLDGFCKAVEGGGGRVVKQLCLHDTATYYPGFYGTEQLLASGSGVECIFYQNDAMAFGGLQYCASKGMLVPHDIGIAGWGDLPIASVIARRLTSMHVPHLKLGQAAAEMMIGRLSDEPVEPCRDIGFRLIPGTTVRNSA
ncbi:LacI family DNA-binding transcriptional regulator [Ruegeria sp. 2205SS24-7]|uniref:LacI family DNA-binding transcriptional regulator n=1 Tax=Ruegeria discodermiae TaxID=3064389 RepID=UPI0027409265|nr:LacI family DNA-binding transcriptional regulator [Ruegeria sp. 2205SS24-7]MDP5219535.1 LacI family DNA-binding transcriptional regulator [Ruegeria sp. 2205SS24-7]